MYLPNELANGLVQDIEAMGKDAPQTFKALWYYLMAEICEECRIYGPALCTKHKTNPMRTL